MDFIVWGREEYEYQKGSGKSNLAHSYPTSCSRSGEEERRTDLEISDSSEEVVYCNDKVTDEQSFSIKEESRMKSHHILLG